MDLLADGEDSVLLLVAQEALNVRVRDGVQRFERLFRAERVQFLADLGQVDAFRSQVDVTEGGRGGRVNLDSGNYGFESSGMYVRLSVQRPCLGDACVQLLGLH